MPLEITEIALQLLSMDATTVLSKPPHLFVLQVRECLLNQYSFLKTSSGKFQLQEKHVESISPKTLR
jgi:hypothetical protein